MKPTPGTYKCPKLKLNTHYIKVLGPAHVPTRLLSLQPEHLREFLLTIATQYCQKKKRKEGQ